MMKRVDVRQLQQLHDRITSKNFFLKFLKTRFDDLIIFFFENSNFQLIRTNSSRLSQVIVVYSFVSDVIDFSIDFS